MFEVPKGRKKRGMSIFVNVRLLPLSAIGKFEV